MPSVVVKKKEKVDELFFRLGANCSFDEFLESFKKEYSKDWDRITSVYARHERMNKKEKGHPMPEPTKYVENMYKFKKSRSSTDNLP